VPVVPAIVLYQPEIPPNTGNLIRLAANTGAALHLVRPLGFALDDRRLKRAGLDHAARETVAVHDDLEAAMSALAARRWLVVETGGAARYDRMVYRSDDVLLFGPETRGLPESVIARFPEVHRLSIPQRSASRSLNLANAASIVFYEAWRQLGFR
jgi:tRNA (cytidine/uridine-2'-O-)-methyltransferase